NSIAALHVEQINGSDFAVGVNSNDTLFLTNNITGDVGVTVSLGNGDNTLNLAAGANTFADIFSVQHINGTVSGDTLTLNGSAFVNNGGPTVDLGDGNDTLSFGGVGLTLTALNIEHIVGTAVNDGLTLLNTVNGLDISLGGGTTGFLNLAAGANT